LPACSRWLPEPTGRHHSTQPGQEFATEPSRSQYDVGIGYGDDIEAACAAMLAAMRGVEGVEQDPRPDAIPWELAGSTVNICAR